MIPLPAVLRAFRSNRNKLNKWRDSGHLKNEIQDGAPGIATLIDKETALEIAFMSVLTAAGYDPKDVKHLIQNWLDLRRRKSLPAIWINDPMCGLLAHRGDDRLNFKALVSAARDQVEMPLGSEMRSSTSLSVINLAEVVARVEAIEKSIKENNRA